MGLFSKASVAGAALFLAPTLASAADFIYQDPPAKDWSGPYVGAHVGGGIALKEWSQIDNGGLGICDLCGSVVTDYSMTGFIGGLQAGYQRQYGNIVLGFEGDLSFANIQGAGDWTAQQSETHIASVDVNWLLTTGPKIGWTHKQMMFFVEGGLAMADEDFSYIGGRGAVFTGHAKQKGWFVGAGTEVAIDANWSVEFAYNFVDFGTNRISLSPDGSGQFAVGGPSGPALFNLDQKLHTAKIGLNYRF